MRQVRLPTNPPHQVGRCSFIADVHYLFSIAGGVSCSYGARDTQRIHSRGFIFTLVHTKTKGRDHLSLSGCWSDRATKRIEFTENGARRDSYTGMMMNILVFVF